MPTYSYRCKQCGNAFDVRQHITDAPLKVCEKCGGALVKIINSVGITFKGSGFYRTDSQSSSAVPAASGEGAGGSSSTGGSGAAGGSGAGVAGGSQTTAASSAPGRTA